MSKKQMWMLGGAVLAVLGIGAVVHRQRKKKRVLAESNPPRGTRKKAKVTPIRQSEPKTEAPVQEETPAAPEARKAEEMHQDEKAVFEMNLGTEDQVEFRRAYDQLEQVFSAHEASGARAVEVNNIGNRITYMLSIRNRLEQSSQNGPMLLALGDEFLDATQKASDHLPIMGQKMCSSSATKLKEIICKGVRASRERVAQMN